MLRTKKADRIVCFFTAVMLVAAVCLWGLVEPVRGDGSHEIGYESLLFDQTKVHTIDITMSDWDDLIANATAEEYRQCDITIDGEKVGTVGIRAKGNTSLSSVATLGSSRYSFKVEFDQYQKGKSYHGLDKMSLNNMIQDATMMKDYLAYTLMDKMGVPSPLCSYAQITVNGEDWGLYLVAEAVEDSFLDRNGMTKGELYKPDSMSFGGGRGNGRDFDIEQFREKEEDSSTTTENTDSKTETATAAPTQDSSFGGSAGGQQMPQGDFSASAGTSAQDGQQIPQGDFAASAGTGAQDQSGTAEPSAAPAAGNTDGQTADSGFGASSGAPAGMSGNTQGAMPSGMPDSMPDVSEMFSGGFGGFNFGMGNDDVKLVYTDDDPENYSNIFNNAKTKIKTKDKTRLIETLRKLNAKEDLDKVVNKEEVITYLAVHNFLCNDDSYTGMMVHNYYLYEENGKLSIIPWDYNLGFGGFAASTNATSTVNSPIDNPVSNGTTDSRPLIGWIFSDEEALTAYHETYDKFIRECIESGWLEQEISRVEEMISSYAAKDPTAFFTTEEHEKAVSTLKTFCAKRGESIRGQLDGTIPSTTNGQRNSKALIDASDISTADMGSMNSTNGGGGGFGGEMPSGMPDMATAGMPSEMPSEMPGGMTVPGGDGFGASGGSSGAQASPSAMPDATPDAAATAAPTEAQPSPDMPEKPAESAGPEAGTNNGGGQNAPQGFPGGGFPGGGDFPGSGGFSGTADQSNLWIQVAVCAGVLLAAILIIRKAGSHNN
jgi:spore coat protein CotH